MTETTKRRHGGARPGSGPKPGTGGGARPRAGRPRTKIDIDQDAAVYLRDLAQLRGCELDQLVSALIRQEWFQLDTVTQARARREPGPVTATYEVWLQMWPHERLPLWFSYGVTWLDDGAGMEAEDGVTGEMEVPVKVSIDSDPAFFEALMSADRITKRWQRIEQQ